MLEARIRLTVATVLFLGWIGWLAYLAATTRNPVVLSRPQLLVAHALVVAQMTGGSDGPEETITIQKILRSDPTQSISAGMKLKLADLKEAALKEGAAVQGWEGAGEYLLPLTKMSNGDYKITLIPASPSYPPPGMTTLDPRRVIYPATAQVLQQYDQIQAEWANQ